MNEHKKFGKMLKRLLIVCLCLVMTFGSVLTIMADVVPGDINGDGKITAFDAQMLAEYKAGTRELTAEQLARVGVLTVRNIIDTILGRTASEPNLDDGIETTFEVKAEDGIVTKDKTVSVAGVTATVPAGTKVTGKTLKLSVKKTNSTEGDVALEENQEQLALDIHVDGVAADNTTPIVITVENALDNGYNQGNLELYHVENSVANEMEQVNAAEALNEHNSFYYDPATGDFTVAMATFSVVRILSDTAQGWEGGVNHEWYNANAKELYIANADQLWSFSQIVGGMAEGVAQDNFDGKTIKLTADINLADDEENNVANKIFYPIGYWNNEGTYERLPVDERVEAVSSGFYTFNGTFDGQGHTIANFYHNTWEMKGDHDWYDPIKEQYYRDGMGLFGRVYKGTVKNLTVDNFSSDGEIATTGVIAAYADGATFENIAITNCNPRVYNIGNGGIVGCVGWYAKEANLKTTFENITVDNSNKISALWGSYDVACGGIVGQYYPTSGQTVDGAKPVNAGIHFENCHVAAQMDVYNDVCANYQYYAYRYTGMMIGSIRENETIDGHVYPKMDGITASGCTVHFGTWNDYYYCELVANSLASYTHDHQFSRLEQVAKVEGTTITPLEGEAFTVPSSGRYNYVVVNGEHATENATCYHFVDGKEHDHDDYNGDGTPDKETVDGQEIFVENNRHIYLEFDQLFTGYGWGVTSKGVNDFAGIDIIDIQLGENEKSVEKFEGTGEKTVTANKAIKLNTLFAEKDGNTIAIKDANIQVAVSALTDDDADVTVSLNKTGFDKWEDYELTFTGNGTVKVTIQDYYFCTPTTITLTVENRADEVKFENKFTGNFLYRVGNQNEVALSSLFTAKDGATIGTVDVTVENVEGNASGTYTAGSAWDSGTIKFSGTGVVKVTITDNDYCTPTELMLEVVTAKNITSVESATDKNVVLLNNTSGGFSVATGYGFYGNGFTITLNPNNHTTKRGAGFDGYIHMNGGTIDNVRIEGPVFAAANIYREQGETGTDADDPVNYFRNGIIIDSGDAVISNSYVSGARTAVYVKNGGDVVIENTTISGGAYANLEVSVANSVKLTNVKTVQKETKDSYGQNKDMIGLAIVIDNASTKLIVDGVEQYNWMTQTQWETMLGDYKSQFPKLFTDNTYTDLWHTNSSGTRIVNTGIIYACGVTDPNMEGTIEGYDIKEITLGTTTGVVYTTVKNGEGTLSDDQIKAPDYEANAQQAIAPKPEFNHKLADNYQQYVDGEDAYCYEDAGVVKIGFTKGQSKVWNPMILSITKGDFTIEEYTVTLNGTDYTGKNITFTEAGNYEVIYTFTDPYNYKTVDGEQVAYGVQYVEVVNITVSVTEEKAKNAEFTFGAEKKDAAKIQIGDKTYLSATGITAADLTQSSSFSNSPVSGNIKHNYNKDTKTGWGCLTNNGQTIYFPIVPMLTTDNTFEHTGSWYGCFPVFEGVIEITDYADKGTGAATVYGGGSTTKPETLNALEPQKYFVYQGTASKVPTTPTTVTKGGYKDKLCYTTQTDLSASNERGEMWTLATYTYTDNKGATYYWYVGYYCAASTNGGCVTGDTMITLADGTQKRIDQLTYQDELLVWDFYNGCYTTTVPSVLFNHGNGVHDVVNLNFSDGTSVGVIDEHEFFDVDANSFVNITYENVSQYLGHRFVKADGEGYTVVTLDSYEYTKEETGKWTILTAKYGNAIADGMLTLTPDPTNKCEDFFRYYAVGENMKYDEEKMQADIEKYGLFTYEDLSAYVTYEEFVAFNGEFYKILVGKGLITVEDIVKALATYAPNH